MTVVLKKKTVRPLALLLVLMLLLPAVSSCGPSGSPDERVPSERIRVPGTGEPGKPGASPISAGSILMSTVGYSTYGYKAIHIRSADDPGDGNQHSVFELIRENDGQPVYTGQLLYWGPKWDSYWWVADFTDFEEIGSYAVRIPGTDLKSDGFVISDRRLTDESLQMVLFDQLDSRRSPEYPGWRDSSTNYLREIQAHIIAVEALCDIYDAIYGDLSAEQKNKLIDNIIYGCEYILLMQEKTGDPMTNGRFKHDLYYPGYSFSAPKIRNIYDTLNAMATLARAYRIVIGFDPAAAAEYRAAFELSYDMVLLRPYYLEEDFYLEEPVHGLNWLSINTKCFYGITSLTFDRFPNTFRTRDRLMYMRACVEMYKSVGDQQYLSKARELGGQIADRQYTDYTDAIDGAYGMFREFDNTEQAFMLDWLQGFSMNLGCIQPTDLTPFIDLISLDPGCGDNARWHNVIQTFMEGYVKTTTGLTPIGMYPVGAYADRNSGGVKFFQALSHGANNLYGLSARNMLKAAEYTNDSSIQKIAGRNIQFFLGLNPGMPNGYNETAWTSTSFIYGLGTNSFAGYYSGRRYIPPLGSGINGFTAGPQFPQNDNDIRITTFPDKPKGIFNADGSMQYNEDYLPHGMAYIAAAALSETPYILTVKAVNGGGTVNIYNGGVKIESRSVSPGGTVTITGLPPGRDLTAEVTDGTVSIRRTFGAVGAGSGKWTVDFDALVEVRMSAPAMLSSGNLTVTLKNHGVRPAAVSVALSADGASLGSSFINETLAAGEEKTVAVALASGGRVMPYAVLGYVTAGESTSVVSAGGFAE
jgi:hypothetical protein